MAQALRDPRFEARLFRIRGWIAATSMGLLVTLLVGRLFWLQVVDHERYTTASQANRVRILPVAPTRGLIFDRHGVLIAENRPVFSLELVPEQVPDLEQTLTALAEILPISDTDRARFNRLLERRRRFEGIPLRVRLNEREAALFAVNRHRFPGVDIQARLARRYPLAGLTAPVLGYVGRIDVDDLRRLGATEYAGMTHVGKRGVELTHESELHGQVGYRQVETNAEGRLLRVLEQTPATPGRDLRLTLDTRVQRAASDAMADRAGAVVALDTTDGGVLALVSNPSFDPNPFVTGIEPSAYAALEGNQRRPLFNRALAGQYPPGSILKPFIGLAGLELGIIDPIKQVECKGYYQIEADNRRYYDWKREGHGKTDLEKAIVESCDVYFYDVARLLGIDRIHDYLAPFGFGRLTGVDLPEEQPGILPSSEWKRRTRGQSWFLGETLIAGIGQGFNLATPIQLATATAILANGGRPLTPHLVRDRDPPNEKRDRVVASQENWQRIIKAMTRVVHSVRGTARRIGKNAPYRIAGKTGTAQVYGIRRDEEGLAVDEESELPEELRDHALFIAFAPAEAPRIAVAVIVEHGGGGGAVAAPIARSVLDAYLLESLK